MCSPYAAEENIIYTEVPRLVDIIASVIYCFIVIVMA
jgi:hypothetical protein